MANLLITGDAGFIVSQARVALLKAWHTLVVFDVVFGFAEATDIFIPYIICIQRPGDLPRLGCSQQLAEHTLDWTAQRSKAEMCRYGWSWQSANPNGNRP